MGMEFSRRFVRARTPELGDALAREYGVAPAGPDRFAMIEDSQEYPHGTTRSDYGTRPLSAKFGEAIYLFYYDGPAGELCGSILYEHSVDGNVVRALGYCPNLWKDPEPDPDRNLWRRVEGSPEPWEAGQFEFSATELQDALRIAADFGSPPEDEVRSLWDSKALREGSYFPASVQDRLLIGVRSHFRL